MAGWSHASQFFVYVCLQNIKDHFAADVSKLAAGEYEDWLQQPLAALAGIVLADQFTRCDPHWLSAHEAGVRILHLQMVCKANNVHV
jgi:hypothetical protein